VFSLEATQAELEAEIRRRDLFSGTSAAGNGADNNSFGATGARNIQSTEDRDLLEQTVASMQRSQQVLGDVRIVR
jgi:hypothetical protein